jgi:hypothetical protein
MAAELRTAAAAITGAIGLYTSPPGIERVAILTRSSKPVKGSRVSNTPAWQPTPLGHLRHRPGVVAVLTGGRAIEDLGVKRGDVGAAT